MELSKKMVSLICLSFIVMILFPSSNSNIEDNLNLSSIESTEVNDNSVEESINTALMDTRDTFEVTNNEEKNIEEENDVINENLATEITERSEVAYKRNDMTLVSGITKEELKEVFMNYNGASTMAHLADALVDAEKEYGVNAFAMAGIVALESGFATSRRAVEDNNLTGYEVYSDASEGRLFNSQYESIMQTAKHLSKNYLTEGGSYFKGLSVDAVQDSYCPDDQYNWHNKVDILASGFLKVYKEIYG